MTKLLQKILDRLAGRRPTVTRTAWEDEIVFPAPLLRRVSGACVFAQVAPMPACSAMSARSRTCPLEHVYEVIAAVDTGADTRFYRAIATLPNINDSAEEVREDRQVKAARWAISNGVKMTPAEIYGLTGWAGTTSEIG